MTSKKKSPLIAWGILIILGLAVYGGSQTSSRPKPPPPSLSQEETKRIKEEAAAKAQKSFEGELTLKAKKAVLSRLKDPDSAKFESIRFNETQKGGSVICGNVDSKNSLGVYTGPKRFISNGSTTFLEEADSNLPELWTSLCFPDQG